jgi:hypothetical protein
LYSNLQARNRDIAKVITAKKLSASDLTYIPDLDAECLRVFKETYKQISLNGDLTIKTKQRNTQFLRIPKNDKKTAQKTRKQNTNNCTLRKMQLSFFLYVYKNRKTIKTNVKLLVFLLGFCFMSCFGVCLGLFLLINLLRVHWACEDSF